MNLKLFKETRLGNISLKNSVVMAPMTRSRAVNNLPNDLMSLYYEQRAGAGLIITEGTAISPNALGYARIPGIYNKEQVEAWKKITTAVHNQGSKIFLQLMHTGRISHFYNMPHGADIVAPSAIAAAGQMWTDNHGMQDLPVPREMNKADIHQVIAEFVQAAKNAINAGFDGVELHGANGYLLEQFLNPGANQRSDEYGGSIENRCRLVVEVSQAVANEIGREKTGIRLSPYGVFNDMLIFDEIEEEYSFLVEKLNSIGLVYIHLVDHSSMGAPAVNPSTVNKIQNQFKSTLILSGGFDLNRAEKELANSNNLIAFGRPFIANPDLVTRLEKRIALAVPDMDTFYTPGAKGYTDYS